MVNFIEVTLESGAKELINTITIQRITANPNNTTAIYFIRYLESERTYISVKESYQDIKIALAK